MYNVYIWFNELLQSIYYVWGEYFESEPTKSPDKCIGVKFKITK